MYKKGCILKSPYEFDNAMYFGINVEVWSDGEIIDYGGKITKHNDETVFINDGYYIKSNFEFKVR